MARVWREGFTEEKGWSFGSDSAGVRGVRAAVLQTLSTEAELTRM